MTGPDNPLVRFGELFERAAHQAPFDHTAAALATVDDQGRPSVRVVLVRSFDDRGFVFFTNYASRKGRDIERNPAAALCFYWPWLDEQVRIEGRLARVTPDESDAYFASRPRGSQIGAWASMQSEPLSARSELEARYFDSEREYDGQTVPRPPHWGGYRLHDRWLYTRTADGWQMERLYP
jgi:pyridoxamine 5'-phosphate oxidase